MSSGKNRLMLMMALAMPGASHALGLGDIHVESALNERLAAEIDIVGATAAELSDLRADLRAAVANRETFLRYGADRPAFLSSAVFKVVQNSRGRPVLSVRSNEAFTEPMVNFLVDLRWHNGEVVRQYTLLLDPPGFAEASRLAAVRAVDRTRAPDTLRTADAVQTPEESMHANGAHDARKMTHVKVGVKATLRGIAWRVGERSEPDLQRMMLAIFRANPSAFDGNINRLHLGAVLTIPSYAEVTAISKADAKREIQAQMVAWRPPTKAAAAMAEPESATATAASTAANTSRADPAPGTGAALDTRLQSLEHELVEVKSLLESQNEKLIVMRRQAEQARLSEPKVHHSAQQAHPLVASPPQSAQRTRPRVLSILGGIGGIGGIGAIGAIGGLAGALAGIYLGLRRRASRLHDSGGDAGQAVHTDASLPAAPSSSHAVTHEIFASKFDAETQPLQPVIGAGARDAPPASDNRRRGDPRSVDLTSVDTVRLDTNLVEFDMSAQHVHMPSALNEQVVVKERRTNLADVLRKAIEREPDRADLRMKLLELYYSAAATNTKDFLEVVQKFARDRDHIEPDLWDKIAFMGRQIAAENPLFAREDAADHELADCA